MAVRTQARNVRSFAEWSLKFLIILSANMNPRNGMINILRGRPIFDLSKGNLGLGGSCSCRSDHLRAGSHHYNIQRPVRATVGSSVLENEKQALALIVSAKSEAA